MPKFNPGEVWKIAKDTRPTLSEVKQPLVKQDLYFLILNVRCGVRKKYTDYAINVVDLQSGEDDILFLDSKTWREFFFKVEEPSDV